MLTLNILQIISLVEKDGNAANACIMGGYSHDANVPDPELAILLMNMLEFQGQLRVGSVNAPSFPWRVSISSAAKGGVDSFELCTSALQK